MQNAAVNVGVGVQGRVRSSRAFPIKTLSEKLLEKATSGYIPTLTMLISSRASRTTKDTRRNVHRPNLSRRMYEKFSRYAKEWNQSSAALLTTLHYYVVARVVQNRLIHSDTILPCVKGTSLIDPDSPRRPTTLADAIPFAQEIAHYQYDSGAIGGANMFGRQCSSLLTGPKHHQAQPPNPDQKPYDNARSSCKGKYLAGRAQPRL
jgi:hypothetical protein